MTPQQRYLFDVDGVITVPGALTAEQVAEMNAAMDARSAAGLEVGASTNRVEEPLRDNPLHFAPAFRAVLDNPKITPILEELIGSGGVRGGGYYDAEEAELPTFRIDHVNLNNIVDTPGSGLHNGGDGGSHAGGAQFFHQQDGRLFNGLLVVAYELQDTIQNDGGFGCVPGSHKADCQLPPEWRDLSDGGAGPPNLRRVPARAGTAIIFTEVLTHVTLPWLSSSGTRRVIFYKFSPHGVAYSGNYLSASEFEHYADMTPRQLALLEAPNARYPGRPRDFEYELADEDFGRRTTPQTGRRQVARQRHKL